VPFRISGRPVPDYYQKRAVGATIVAMKRDAHKALLPAPAAADDSIDTPALRLFALLERVAAHDRLFSLQSLVEDTGWPKPSVHRMLQQLEAAGLVQREGETRHYSTGLRLRRFAHTLLANSTFHGARHRVLRALVDEVGESCNITALAGGEVVYLDRVETAAPLRFYLHPGSQVPVHCSASGKVFLSQMLPAQRARLLQAAPLERCTPTTLTDAAALADELADVQRLGYALDREEFLPGLVCVAVPVPSPDAQGRAALCVALQAPAVRLPIERALTWLPALRRAAQALGRLEAEALAAPAPAPAALKRSSPKAGPRTAAMPAAKPHKKAP
jgi:DNA-binding IclR family transcriptional regulator